MDTNPSKMMAPGVLNLDDLPDSIIEKILTHLPIRDAAKSSILSNKWKNHWRNIPALVFDDSFTFARPDSVEGQLYTLLDLSQVLLNHCGPIHKFALSLNLDSLESCPQIHNMMLFLLDKDVHEFTYHSLMTPESHKMPSYLFAYQQLRHLHLAYCEVEVPPTFEGFPHLISLCFYCVNVDSGWCKTFTLNNFISKCPLLEDLEIRQYSGISRLKIDAPKLKSLYICGSARSLSFNNTPLLSSVSILYVDEFGKAGETLSSKVIRFFEGLSVLKYLRILELEFITEKKILTSIRLPITISHLKVLDVVGAFYCESDLSLLLAMIINSPNLQKLKLEGKSMRNAQESDSLKLFKWEELSDVTFQKLQDFHMTNFLGTSLELEFVKFMLAKSVVLETLTLDGIRDCKLNISAALAKLAPGSWKVKINIFVKGYKDW